MYASSVNVIFLVNKVLWGGQWHDKTGVGSAEDMEQLFSYLSKWGFTTRNMLAYSKIVSIELLNSVELLNSIYLGREEFLTEVVVFWNDRKLESLPKSLVKRLKKALINCYIQHA